MNYKYSATFIKEICIDICEHYKLLDKNTEIPIYYKDGAGYVNFTYAQTILKNNSKIGGISIEQSIENIIHIDHIAICITKHGDGRNVIALLFCLNPNIIKITATPTENSFLFQDSIAFWKRIGGRLIPDVEITRENFFNEYRKHIIKSNLENMKFI